MADVIATNQNPIEDIALLLSLVMLQLSANVFGGGLMSLETVKLDSHSQTLLPAQDYADRREFDRTSKLFAYFIWSA